MAWRPRISREICFPHWRGKPEVPRCLAPNGTGSDHVPELELAVRGRQEVLIMLPAAAAEGRCRAKSLRAQKTCDGDRHTYSRFVTHHLAS